MAEWPGKLIPVAVFWQAWLSGSRLPHKSGPAAIPEGLRQEHAVPGLSVAMACDGKTVFEQAFGWADQTAAKS
jgi:hypothetical protein